MPTNGPVFRSWVLRALLSLALGVSFFQAHAQVPVSGCGQSNLLQTILLAGGGGTVTFTQDCSITLTNTLVIDNSVTIDAGGHNVSIGATAPMQLVSLASGVSFTAIQITFAGGRTTNFPGAALSVSLDATAVFTNCTFSGNTAIGAAGLPGFPGADSSGDGQNGNNGLPGSDASGGAIFNQGTLTLLNCRFLTNPALAGNGGDGGAGGNGGGQPLDTSKMGARDMLQAGYAERGVGTPGSGFRSR